MEVLQHQQQKHGEEGRAHALCHHEPLIEQLLRFNGNRHRHGCCNKEWRTEEADEDQRRDQRRYDSRASLNGDQRGQRTSSRRNVIDEKAVNEGPVRWNPSQHCRGEITHRVTKDNLGIRIQYKHRQLCEPEETRQRPP